jgi:hypothetical protein
MECFTISLFKKLLKRKPFFKKLEQKPKQRRGQAAQWLVINWRYGCA